MFALEQRIGLIPVRFFGVHGCGENKGGNSSEAHQMCASLILDRNFADLSLEGPPKWRQITHGEGQRHSSVGENRSTRFLRNCKVSSIQTVTKRE